MPYDITTKRFHKAPPNKITQLSAPIDNDDETIAVFSTAGVPTGTPVTAIIDLHDANGDLVTPATKFEVISGEVSGSTLINCVRGAEGTAQSHGSSAVVEFVTTAYDWNALIDGLLIAHKPDGMLKAFQAVSTLVSSNDAAPGVAQSIVATTGNWYDLTDLTATLTTEGGDLMVDTQLMATTSIAADFSLRLVVDGVFQGKTYNNGGTAGKTFNAHWTLKGVSAAAHTIKVQVAVATNCTFGNYPQRAFSVVELATN